MKRAKKSHKIGCTLTKEKKYQEASLYYLNALFVEPGNIEIISSYTDNIMNLVKEKYSLQLTSDATKELSWHEAFLRDRTAYVEPDDISKILDMLKKVEEEKNNLLVSNNQKSNNKFQTFLDEIKHSGFEPQIPSQENLENEISFYEDLIQFLDESSYELDDSIKQEINVHADKIKSTYESTRLINETRAVLEYAKAQEISSAPYCLQVCENSIRQLLLLKQNLNQEQKSEIDCLLKDLQKTSDEIIKKKNEEESGKAWGKFHIQFDGKIKKATGWSEPVSYKPDKQCQKSIEFAQITISQVQQEMMNFSTKFYQEKIYNILNKLNNTVASIQEVQHIRYNKWALISIKDGYRNGIKAIGNVYNDHEDIVDAMVKYLAPINTRYLFAEINRSYSEVFEYLFKNLKASWSKEDFNNKGYKLNVLDRMARTQKFKVSDF